jgi:hypothetical protein
MFNAMAASLTENKKMAENDGGMQPVQGEDAVTTSPAEKGSKPVSFLVRYLANQRREWEQQEATAQAEREKIIYPVGDSLRAAGRHIWIQFVAAPDQAGWCAVEQDGVPKKMYLGFATENAIRKWVGSGKEIVGAWCRFGWSASGKYEVIIERNR